MSKKLTFIVTSIILALFIPISCIIVSKLQVNNVTTTAAVVRNIELEPENVDYESILNKFENGKLETEGSLTTFEGYQTISISDLAELDNLSASDLEQAKETKVKYNFSYDSETNLVTLSAESIDANGEIEIEEISGTAFTDENGKIDAMFEVDGDYILLSEMQDAGMIQNCGWFKNLFKKVVKAVVAVVVVSAVVATVVATAGAGMGAVIAAGAVAGGVTGAVAGGIISYQETGKVQIWAVVGGLIGGAALGGLTGWAVGTIVGAGSQMTVGFGKGSFKSSKECLNYHFKKHGAKVGAKTVKEYSTMAAKTAKEVIDKKIVAKKLVEGATANVYRYKVGKYYIDMAKTAKEIIIVSFGLY